MIRIEREFQVKQDSLVTTQKELIAELPDESGNYDTGQDGVGEIEMLVCPPNIDRGIQKIIFEAKIMEKDCKRGTTFRRVVKMPFSGKEVFQDTSLTERLIFKRNGASLTEQKER